MSTLHFALPHAGVNYAAPIDSCELWFGGNKGSGIGESKGSSAVLS